MPDVVLHARRLKAGGRHDCLPHIVKGERGKTNGSTALLPEDTRDGNEDRG